MLKCDETMTSLCLHGVRSLVEDAHMYNQGRYNMPITLLMMCTKCGGARGGVQVTLPGKVKGKKQHI